MGLRMCLLVGGVWACCPCVGGFAAEGDWWIEWLSFVACFFVFSFVVLPSLCYLLSLGKLV